MLFPVRMPTYSWICVVRKMQIIAFSSGFVVYGSVRFNLKASFFLLTRPQLQKKH